MYQLLNYFNNVIMEVKKKRILCKKTIFFLNGNWIHVCLVHVQEVFKLQKYKNKKFGIGRLKENAILYLSIWNICYFSEIYVPITYIIVKL